MRGQGVIVGCDQRQEWLLPWWWKHYSSHNSFPVAFADFGMSEKALAWCRERGTCLKLPAIKVLQENEIPPSEKERWEDLYGKRVWSVRPTWFKKPLALLNSPFTEGIWIDLDCQINGSLDPLFNSLAFGAEIGLVREPQSIQDSDRKNGYLLPGEVNYNSGVIAFRRNAGILRGWVEEASANNGQHAGDQAALNRAIHKHQPSVIEFPSIFNWLYYSGPNPYALIYHFLGSGKYELLQQLGLSTELA